MSTCRTSCVDRWTMKGLLTYGHGSMDPYTQIGYLLAMVNNDVNNVGTYYLGIGTYRLAIGSYYLGIGTHRLAIGTYWGNVSAPGARRAFFVTRALPVDCCC